MAGVVLHVSMSSRGFKWNDAQGSGCDCLLCVACCASAAWCTAAGASAPWWVPLAGWFWPAVDSPFMQRFRCPSVGSAVWFSAVGSSADLCGSPAIWFAATLDSLMALRVLRLPDGI